MAWGKPYEKVYWRKFWWDYRTKAFYMEWEKRAHKTFTIYQACFHDGSLSGDTHLGGGIADSNATAEDMRIGKNIGGFGWHRVPPLFDEHTHFGPKDHKTASIALKEQQVDYIGPPKGNGLSKEGGSWALDDHPYRNNGAEFNYEIWLRDRTISDKIMANLRDIRHLLRRNKKLKKKLHD